MYYRWWALFISMSYVVLVCSIWNMNYRYSMWVAGATEGQGTSRLVHNIRARSNKIQPSTVTHRNCVYKHVHKVVIACARSCMPTSATVMAQVFPLQDMQNWVSKVKFTQRHSFPTLWDWVIFKTTQNTMKMVSKGYKTDSLLNISNSPFLVPTQHVWSFKYPPLYRMQLSWSQSFMNFTSFKMSCHFWRRMDND